MFRHFRQFHGDTVIAGGEAVEHRVDHRLILDDQFGQFELVVLTISRIVFDDDFFRDNLHVLTQPAAIDQICQCFSDKLFDCISVSLYMIQCH